VNLDQLVPRGFLPPPGRQSLGISNTGCSYGPDVLPATQPATSEQSGRLKQKVQPEMELPEVDVMRLLDELVTGRAEFR